MAPPAGLARRMFGRRTRLTDAQADAVLDCYAAGLEPNLAAEHAKLSANSVYRSYGMIRRRLIQVGYFTDGALSVDEPALGDDLRAALRARRGIRDENVFENAAELIFFFERWPPKLVRAHITEIVAKTGPLGRDVSDETVQAVHTFVRSARDALVLDRRKRILTNQ